MWWVVLVEGLVIVALGCLLHFAYVWSGRKKIVAVFAAVNESVWEHIKLALSGIFACTLVDMWFLGSEPNYWFAKSIEFIVPVVMIPVIFYGYTSVTKRAILLVDIISFTVTAFVSVGVFVWMLELRSMDGIGEMVSMVITVVVLAAYLLLTRFPLHNFLFRDPITGKYGLDATHEDVHKHKK